MKNISEGCLKEAIAKACRMEDEMYESLVKVDDHEFSERYRKKMKQMLKDSTDSMQKTEPYKSKTVRKRRLPKRYIAAVILIAVFASASVFAGDFLRDQFVKIHEKFYSDHTDIRFEKVTDSGEVDTDLPEEFEIHRLEHVPDGYELDQEEIDEVFYHYFGSYSTPGEEKVLNYTQIAIAYADMFVSSAGSSAKPIIIKGKEGYYITDEYEWNTVCYIGNQYIYLISSNEKVEDIVDIFEKNKNIV